MRGAPAVAAIAQLLFDQDVEDFAAPLGGSLIHELVRQVRKVLDPARDLLAGQLPGEGGRLRAVLVGVAEDPDGIEPGLGQEALQLLDVGIGLAGESDDEIGPDSGLRHQLPDLVNQRGETLPVAEPAHRAQYGAAGMLEGQVEVRRYAWCGRHHLDESGPQLGGLQVADADPADTGYRGEAGQQGLQQPEVTQVLAVGGGVLADEQQLTGAMLGEPASASQPASAIRSCGGRETKAPRNAGIAQKLQRRSHPEAILSGATTPPP